MKKTGLATTFSFIFLVLFFACKHKTKEKPESERFFPVLPFLKSQVADIDTSLYSIRKVVYVDSTRSDTTYYRREQFRELASEFLSLPDISTPAYEDRFTEEKQFDETINRAILRYKPINAEKEDIQLEELLIRPDPPDDKVTSIIINYVKNTKDSSVQKRMLWQVDRSFQVTTTRQLPGQAETELTYKVIWNDEDNE
jgi:hypothetical protein